MPPGASSSQAGKSRRSASSNGIARPRQKSGQLIIYKDFVTIELTARRKVYPPSFPKSSQNLEKRNGNTQLHTWKYRFKSQWHNIRNSDHLFLALLKIWHPQTLHKFATQALALPSPIIKTKTGNPSVQTQ